MTAQHGFHQWVEVGPDGEPHFARIFRDGQQLYPEIEGYGRLLGFKFDALGFIPFDDTQGNLSHGLHRHRQCVAVEREVLYFVARAGFSRMQSCGKRRDGS